MPVSWLLDSSLTQGDTGAYSLLFYMSPAASVPLVFGTCRHQPAVEPRD